MMRKKIDLVNQSTLSDAAQPRAARADGAAAPAPATEPTRDDDVLEAIHGLMHLARSQQHKALRDAGQALSPLEGRVLAYFAHHPGAALSDLVAHSGRDKGQLARMVSGLREQGLLRATPDAQDRRITRLYLSPEAQAQHHALVAQRRALSERAAAGLSATERRQLLALLAKVREALSAEG